MVGRSNIADNYVITDNRSVSRSHITLIIQNNICYIVDNNSLNNTYVNGVKLIPEKKVELKNGDSVRLSNERFWYYK